ncbi:LOW QUALITY PROTEIN: hypothetical protein PanWU01x14_321850 [Parasponia andersonii]|uniref:Uncharacterized protein n=1 Tax=Parasponia andersonii TaxID=3476 RepID=A0A2P5AKY2_PARAD|nr:LOW QUALITY PROTEIN: hypothetical protein PanWU01x14_321850 [Parasponia andersonii]
MPRLETLLTILQDYLHKVTERLVDHVRRHRDLVRCVSRGLIRNSIILEHLVGHLVVLGQLQGGVRVHVGHPVDGIPELPLHPPCRVHKPDGARDVDLPVVVRSLGVRPGCACRQIPPERSELVQRPSPPNGSLREIIRGRRSRLLGVGVADDSLSGQHRLGEAGSHNEIVLGFLVGGDENGEALADVDVKGVVSVLNGVGAFHLNQLHGVSLDPEIEGVLKPHVADPILVRLPGLHGEEGLVGVIALSGLTVD